MRETDFEEFSKELGMLFSVHGKKATAEDIDSWFEYLREYDIGSVVHAIKETIHSGSTYLTIHAAMPYLAKSEYSKRWHKLAERILAERQEWIETGGKDALYGRPMGGRLEHMEKERLPVEEWISAHRKIREAGERKREG